MAGTSFLWGVPVCLLRETVWKKADDRLRFAAVQALLLMGCREKIKAIHLWWWRAMQNRGL